jgi:hypothetical protein
LLSASTFQTARILLSSLVLSAVLAHVPVAAFTALCTPHVPSWDWGVTCTVVMFHVPVLVVLPAPLGVLISAPMLPRSARAAALALLPLAVRECARAHSLPILWRSASMPHAVSMARMPRAAIVSRSPDVGHHPSPGPDEVFLWPGCGSVMLWAVPAAGQVAPRRLALVVLACSSVPPGSSPPGPDEMSLWPGWSEVMLRCAPAGQVAPWELCRVSPPPTCLARAGPLLGVVCLIFPPSGSDEMSLWPGRCEAMSGHATAAKQVGLSGQCAVWLSAPRLALLVLVCSVLPPGCPPPGPDEMSLWPVWSEVMLRHAPAAGQVASWDLRRASPPPTRLARVGTLLGVVCLVFPPSGSDEMSLWPGGCEAVSRHATAAKQVGPLGQRVAGTLAPRPELVVLACSLVPPGSPPPGPDEMFLWPGWSELMLRHAPAARQVAPRESCCVPPPPPPHPLRVAQACLRHSEKHALPHGCGRREPTPVWVLFRDGVELLPTLPPPLPPLLPTVSGGDP